MIRAKFSWEIFEKVPIVGIIRNVSLEVLEEILPVAIKAGLTTLEITMNTREVEKMIVYAKEKAGPQMNIGAGTVCSKSDLRRALRAGAQFIVTPVLVESVIKRCVKKDVTVFPGAYTPTEIYSAWQLGAPVVKIFPATALGPSFMKDLKGPLPQIKLLPTGGVSLENIVDFKKAGAAGYGIGSQLFDKKMIADKDWKSLGDHIKKYVQKVT